MQKYVIKEIVRPDHEMVARFEALDVSTVYEAQGKIGLMDYKLRPIQQGRGICGPAVTVICQPGDNLMIHAAIEVCQPGDILVITTVDDDICGMIGELIVSALIERGVKGVVIDSGIRDAKRLRDLGFPVWTKAIYSRGTTKTRGGWVNAPAVCGGCMVHPGDLILANDDGVVVVAQDDLRYVLDSSNQRVAREEDTKNKIFRGELSIDFYGLRDVLKKDNVVYYDNPSKK